MTFARLAMIWIRIKIIYRMQHSHFLTQNIGSCWIWWDLLSYCASSMHYIHSERSRKKNPGSSVHALLAGCSWFFVLQNSAVYDWNQSFHQFYHEPLQHGKESCLSSLSGEIPKGQQTIKIHLDLIERPKYLVAQRSLSLKQLDLVQFCYCLSTMSPLGQADTLALPKSWTRQEGPLFESVDGWWLRLAHLYIYIYIILSLERPLHGSVGMRWKYPLKK